VKLRRARTLPSCESCMSDRVMGAVHRRHCTGGIAPAALHRRHMLGAAWRRSYAYASSCSWQRACGACGVVGAWLWMMERLSTIGETANAESTLLVEAGAAVWAAGPGDARGTQDRTRATRRAIGSCFADCSCDRCGCGPTPHHARWCGQAPRANRMGSGVWSLRGGVIWVPSRGVHGLQQGSNSEATTPGTQQCTPNEATDNHDGP